MGKYRLVAAIMVQKGNKWLLVRKPRKDNAWQFPQGGVDIGETLVEAATRELSEECGYDLSVEIIPEQVGEYKYDFPVDFIRHHGKFSGARVVFFNAMWIFGEAKVDNNEIVEARWCLREEIQNLVEEKYWEVVEGML